MHTQAFAETCCIPVHIWNSPLGRRHFWNLAYLIIKKKAVRVPLVLREENEPLGLPRVGWRAPSRVHGRASLVGVHTDGGYQARHDSLLG